MAFALANRMSLAAPCKAPRACSKASPAPRRAALQLVRSSTAVKEGKKKGARF